MFICAPCVLAPHAFVFIFNSRVSKLCTYTHLHLSIPDITKVTYCTSAKKKTVTEAIVHQKFSNDHSIIKEVKIKGLMMRLYEESELVGRSMWHGWTEGSR